MLLHKEQCSDILWKTSDCKYEYIRRINKNVSRPYSEKRTGS